MLDIFVKAWDKNNKKLLKYFEEKSPNSYQDIVEKVVSEVLNPYLTDENNNVDYPLCNGLALSSMTVIDNGDYQGTTIYVIPCETYQPSINDYYVTHNYYGSCSVCDVFEGIESDYNLWDSEQADKRGAAKAFHTLALHILQRFKELGGDNE